ncbi:secretion protein [Novacetimonas maltaceti]|uniref:Outer membrane protein OprM n=2 Tax=Acetobacteraceae TaxID=433 RepID=A0A2S3VXZ6_9PROT|nr:MULTISPECIES: efflux transporter outer membrane subunit [Acetobacteraceae]POF61486.1 Outer membrane protein OprM precursor [Novacetimonas maltaceti]PYD58231.1 secretion protein [Novacetimonas maltaceti]BAK84705.1 secretion system type I outer membrane efflux pump lipoprotein NodT [Komagataeibacter medellinensis NBRC 3288]
MSGSKTTIATVRLLRSRLAAWLALGLPIAGCTVGPDYHKSSPASPTSWHQSVVSAESHPVQAPLDPEWWNIYNDPVLTALEQQVAGANLDLRAAAYRFAESMAERRIASAAQFPHAEANASYARERASPNGVLGLLGTMEEQGAGSIASGTQGFGPTRLPGAAGASSFNLPQYGMNASWEVDFWGHVRRQVEAATAAMRATEDMRRDVLVSLMAETAQDYLELRGVQAQIGIVENNIGIARHSVQLTTLRFTQGAATRLDVADSTGQLYSFESRLPVLKSQEVHLINALSFLVAREPGALTAQLGKPAPVPPVPVSVPVGLPSELAERRPDIRMAEERLHAATANIGVAIADFFPRVTLSGSLDVQALQFSGLGSWASRQYGFGPTATLPIFEGGRLTGQLRLRKAQQREAAVMLQRTVLKAWQEIDDAMADLSAAQNQRDRLAEAVKENQIAVQTAQAQYVQGSSDFLNVLTLQNALLATQNQLVQATTNVSTSAARLYRALGGGWERRFPVEGRRYAAGSSSAAKGKS